MISLIVALAATVAALAAVVWSGLARRRRLHYALVVLMLLCLTMAVWRAEVFGRGLIFDGLAGTLHSIHMVSVALTLLWLVLTAHTGWKLARAEAVDSVSSPTPLRRSHRRRAFSFVVLVALTSALGIAMTLAARPA
ncbi:MAG: hypothetical protein ACT4PU_03670 [Planctomycetota bacterium]